MSYSFEPRLVLRKTDGSSRILEKLINKRRPDSLILGCDVRRKFHALLPTPVSHRVPLQNEPLPLPYVPKLFIDAMRGSGGACADLLGGEPSENVGARGKFTL